MPSLREVVLQQLPGLLALSEAQANHKPAPGVWSAKQIIGHLIDSGYNNNLRFVHVAEQSGLNLPGYNQNVWVETNRYQERTWLEVLALWEANQLHLAHVIERLPVDSLAHTLSIKGGEPVTLAWLAEDYVRHQLHHLAQIPGRVGP